MVRLPVEGTTRTNEVLTEKQEIQEGVYLAGAITKFQAGYVISSIVNTTDEAVEIEETVLRVTEVEPSTPLGPPGDGNTGRYLDRPEGGGVRTIAVRTPKRRRKERDRENMLGLPGYFSFTWRGAEWYHRGQA